jgi:hypothetical protein
MNRKFILGAIFAVALLGALFYVYGGSRVPPGQPSLQRLTAENTAVIKKAFNAASDNVRVLVLLSPT